MAKILQILIIENRDLAHAQTFCTRVVGNGCQNGKVWKLSYNNHKLFNLIKLQCLSVPFRAKHKMLNCVLNIHLRNLKRLENSTTIATFQNFITKTGRINSMIIEGFSKTNSSFSDEIL